MQLFEVLELAPLRWQGGQLVAGQVQIAQCGEPTELAQDLPTRLHSPQIQSRHPSVVIGTNPPVLGRGVREAKLQHGFDPGLEGASRRVDGPRRRQAQQHRLVGGGHRVLKVGTGGRTGYGSVCLGQGVTSVRAGSVDTEGEWFREPDTEALVAPGAGQAACQRILVQVQICQSRELAQFRWQRRQLVAGQR